MLGLVVFGIHMLFWRPDSLLNEDSGGLARFLVWVMGLGGSKLPLGFVLVMATLTWFNRMLNTSTSGRWVTVWLLLATLLPVLIQIDGLIALVRDLFSDADIEPFLGWEYNFLISGLALTLTYCFSQTRKAVQAQRDGEVWYQAGGVRPGDRYLYALRQLSRRCYRPY